MGEENGAGEIRCQEYLALRGEFAVEWREETPMNAADRDSLVALERAAMRLEQALLRRLKRRAGLEAERQALQQEVARLYALVDSLQRQAAERGAEVLAAAREIRAVVEESSGETAETGGEHAAD